MKLEEIETIFDYATPEEIKLLTPLRSKEEYLKFISQLKDPVRYAANDLFELFMMREDYKRARRYLEMMYPGNKEKQARTLYIYLRPGCLVEFWIPITHELKEAFKDLLENEVPSAQLL